MEERWFIVERLEEDWMFYFWCSENQAAADAGVVVLGRQRFDRLNFKSFLSMDISWHYSKTALNTENRLKAAFKDLEGTYG